MDPYDSASVKKWMKDVRSLGDGILEDLTSLEDMVRSMINGLDDFEAEQLYTMLERADRVLGKAASEIYLEVVNVLGKGGDVHRMLEFKWDD